MANSYKAADFIAVIPGTGGIISTIAKRVGCVWNTAKAYIEKHPSVKRAYDDECERVLDLAETVIIDSITKSDTQTAKWYLMMRGRGRGYAQTTRSEVTGKDGKPIQLTQVIEGIPKDAI